MHREGRHRERRETTLTSEAYPQLRPKRLASLDTLRTPKLAVNDAKRADFVVSRHVLGEGSSQRETSRGLGSATLCWRGLNSATLCWCQTPSSSRPAGPELMQHLPTRLGTPVPPRFLHPLYPLRPMCPCIPCPLNRPCRNPSTTQGLNSATLCWHDSGAQQCNPMLARLRGSTVQPYASTTRGLNSATLC